MGYPQGYEQAAIARGFACMTKYIYRFSTWLAERSRQRLFERRCTVHELGAMGMCRKCRITPLYGKIAWAKGKCLWYVEIPRNIDFNPVAMGAYMPRYKRKPIDE